VRRGFKAEAERIATDTRLELGLKCTDRLDPTDLAKHLEIPVVTMGELESHHCARSDFRQYFSATDPDSFSAVTIFVSNYRRMIVHNENHHPHRQSSNIAHEISHTLLEHVPTAIVGSNGQRCWDSEMEQEANWLGAALLVPREGALELARGGATAPEISAHYGVSESLGTWRVVQTGVYQQLDRTRRWYG
jgi:Zn-dependent peptidase ImmA (M78 family)